MHNNNKKGPELLVIDEKMLAGVETLAAIAKKAHDYHTSDFLILIKTALSKYPSMVKDAHKIAVAGNDAAAAITKFTGLIEQMFPKTEGGAE